MKDKTNFTVKLYYSLFFYTFFLEALTVFAILLLLMFSGYFLKEKLSFGVLIGIITKSFLLSVTYILIFKIFKFGYSLVRRIFSGIIYYDAHKPAGLEGFLTDIFLTLALLLTTGPVRPILQIDQIIPVAGSVNLTTDALTTLLILGFIALSAIVINLRTDRSIFKYAYTFLIISLILLAVFINNQPYTGSNIYDNTTSAIADSLKRGGVDIKEALKGSDQAKAVLYYWLGITEVRSGNRQQGNAYLLKSIDLNPAYGPAYSSISLSYSYLDEWSAAMVFADKCIEYSPGYAGCYFAMGKSYDLTGKKDEAYKFFRKAVELDPKTREYQNTLNEFLNKNPQFEE